MQSAKVGDDESPLECVTCLNQPRDGFKRRKKKCQVCRKKYGQFNQVPNEDPVSTTAMHHGSTDLSTLNKDTSYFYCFSSELQSHSNDGAVLALPHIDWDGEKFRKANPPPLPSLEVYITPLITYHSIFMRIDIDIVPGTVVTRAFTDTCAQTCVAGREFLKTISMTENMLIQTSHKIKNVTNQSLKVIGLLLVEISYQSRKTYAVIYISDNVNGVFLSENVQKRLGVISTGYPNNTRSKKLNGAPLDIHWRDGVRPVPWYMSAPAPTHFNGAVLLSEDNQGKTALDYAIEKKQRGCVEFIRDIMFRPADDLRNMKKVRFNELVSTNERKSPHYRKHNRKRTSYDYWDEVIQSQFDYWRPSPQQTKRERQLKEKRNYYKARSKNLNVVLMSDKQGVVVPSKEIETATVTHSFRDPPDLLKHINEERVHKVPNTRSDVDSANVPTREWGLPVKAPNTLTHMHRPHAPKRHTSNRKIPPPVPKKPDKFKLSNANGKQIIPKSELRKLPNTEDSRELPRTEMRRLPIPDYDMIEKRVPPTTLDLAHAKYAPKSESRSHELKPPTKSEPTNSNSPSYSGGITSDTPVENSTPTHTPTPIEIPYKSYQSYHQNNSVQNPLYRDIETPTQTHTKYAYPKPQHGPRYTRKTQGSQQSHVNRLANHYNSLQQPIDNHQRKTSISSSNDYTPFSYLTHQNGRKPKLKEFNHTANSSMASTSSRGMGMSGSGLGTNRTNVNTMSSIASSVSSSRDLHNIQRFGDHGDYGVDTNKVKMFSRHLTSKSKPSKWDSLRHGVTSFFNSFRPKREQYGRSTWSQRYPHQRRENMFTSFSLPRKASAKEFDDLFNNSVDGHYSTTSFSSLGSSMVSNNRIITKPSFNENSKLGKSIGVSPYDRFRLREMKESISGDDDVFDLTFESYLVNPSNESRSPKNENQPTTNQNRPSSLVQPRNQNRPCSVLPPTNQNRPCSAVPTTTIRKVRKQKNVGEGPEKHAKVGGG